MKAGVLSAAAIALFGLGLIAAAPSAILAASERVVEIPTRPGVTVNLILRGDPQGDPPIAILFAGGHGVLNLHEWDGLGNPSGNFLVRTRKHWVKHNLLVAVPDAPSDMLNDGMHLWRTSPEHSADIDAIIKYLRRYSKGPVFLIGASRGTISAAGIAARLAPEKLAGIVLTASVTRYNRGRDKDRVETAKLANIRVPVLLAHHKDDICDVTRFDDLDALAKAFINAPKVEIKAYTGGGNYRGSECSNRTAHGFRGIEIQVVADIAAWIRAVTAKRR